MIDYCFNSFKKQVGLYVIVAITIGLAVLIIFVMMNNSNRYKSSNNSMSKCSYLQDSVTGEFHEMECEDDYNYVDTLGDDYDQNYNKYDNYDNYSDENYNQYDDYYDY